MSQPNLIIIAGCNGSGKSTFSKAMVKGIIPFDFDKTFMEIYASLYDSELRSEIAYNATKEKFESSINGAFSNGTDFCYETNFDAHPIYWAQKAKELGYQVKLVFYCLDSMKTAIKRVAFRTENKGHFVPNQVIDFKWKEGYKNLNLHFRFFDEILLIDNSLDTSPPQPIFLLINESEGMDVEFYQNKIPTYAKLRFPEIYKILKDAIPKKYSVVKFFKYFKGKR